MLATNDFYRTKDHLFAVVVHFETKDQTLINRFTIRGESRTQYKSNCWKIDYVEICCPAEYDTSALPFRFRKSHFILWCLVFRTSVPNLQRFNLQNMQRTKKETRNHLFTCDTSCKMRRWFSIDHKRSFACLGTADRFAVRHENRVAKKKSAGLCRLEFPRVKERVFQFYRKT